MFCVLQDLWRCISFFLEITNGFLLVGDAMFELSKSGNKILFLICFIGMGFVNSQADTFGIGTNQFIIDFTTIGNPGNIANKTGYGSFGAVGYTYEIGTYEITVNQYNAAKANGVEGLGNGHWSGDQPVTIVSWYQAAAFVNWLNTSTGHQAAYNLSYSGKDYTMNPWQPGESGYNVLNQYRNSLAVYVLPSVDEWYKAAYYNPNKGTYNLYPTGNAAPISVTSGTNAGTAVYNLSFTQVPASAYAAGGLSTYGTMGQGGNVWEWEENPHSGSYTNAADLRDVRGGAWNDDPALQSSFPDLYYNPTNGYYNVGFRVAEISAVPEPTTYFQTLIGIGMIGLVMILSHKKQA